MEIVGQLRQFLLSDIKINAESFKNSARYSRQIVLIWIKHARLLAFFWRSYLFFLFFFGLFCGCHRHLTLTAVETIVAFCILTFCTVKNLAWVFIQCSHIDLKVTCDFKIERARSRSVILPDPYFCSYLTCCWVNRLIFPLHKNTGVLFWASYMSEGE